MAALSNNPARVALLTAMAESTDNGSKVWDEQPPVRNSTKNALLQSGYVKIANKKAAITAEGRAALTKATLAEMTLPTPAPEAPAAEPKADAKAKFEAARAEVVKPNGKTSKAEPKTARQKAKAMDAAADAPKAAQPAANPPEQKAEPVQQAEQPAPEAPQEEVLPLHRLVRILHTEYDVTALEAPTYAIIWSAEILADKTDIETAKAALAALNRKRKVAGKVQATPAEGHFLA